MNYEFSKTININNMRIILTTLMILFASVIYSQTATGIIWNTDTVEHSAPDTLSRLNSVPITNLLNKWTNTFSFSIIADSTIEISDTSAFTAGRTLKIDAGVSYLSGNLNPQSFKDIYIRKYSSESGAAQYTITARGF
jgi:hypothetical protein